MSRVITFFFNFIGKSGISNQFFLSEKQKIKLEGKKLFFEIFSENVQLYLRELRNPDSQLEDVLLMPYLFFALFSSLNFIFKYCLLITKHKIKINKPISRLCLCLSVLLCVLFNYYDIVIR